MIHNIANVWLLSPLEIWLKVEHIGIHDKIIDHQKPTNFVRQYWIKFMNSGHIKTVPAWPFCGWHRKSSISNKYKSVCKSPSRGVTTTVAKKHRPTHIFSKIKKNKLQKKIKTICLLHLHLCMRACYQRFYTVNVG